MELENCLLDDVPGTELHPYDLPHYFADKTVEKVTNGDDYRTVIYFDDDTQVVVIPTQKEIPSIPVVDGMKGMLQEAELTIGYDSIRLFLRMYDDNSVSQLQFNSTREDPYIFKIVDGVS